MSSTRAWEPGVGDAFGFALLDYLEHGSEAWSLFIERDDGLLETIDTGVLFTQESDWSVAEAPVGDRAGQRVLDVGAGAGAGLPLPWLMGTLSADHRMSVENALVAA
jgi:hypothetical protein